MSLRDRSARSRRWSAAPLLSLAALLVVSMAACSGDSSTAPVPVASVGLMPTTAELVVGTTQQLTATPRDGSGAALTGRPVSWTSSAGAVASVSPSGLVTALSVGSAIITATSEGANAVATVAVIPVPVASVTVTPTTASLQVGATEQLSATPRDSANNPLTGRLIAWVSSDTLRATVSAAGLVTAITPGPVTITATSEGRSGSAALTVLPPPVATVVVTPSSGSVNVAETLQLAVELRDAGDNVLTGRTVTWTSGNAAIATVSAGGSVTGVGIGTVTITATSETRTGTAAITVNPAAGAPSITSISPASLLPGSTATITGNNFSTTLSENVVTVRGVVMPVVSATATQLVVTVPCVNGGPQDVRVRSGGLDGAPFTHAIGTTQRTLAVGQAAIVTDAAASRCNEIAFGAGPGRYLISVYSIAEGANTLSDFALRGNPATGAEPVASIRTAQLRAPARLSSAERQQAELDRRHHDRLEENARILRQLGAQARQMPSADVVAAELPALGARRVFKWPPVSGGCAATGQQIVARAVYVGTRAIIWEDSANTIQSATNALYAASLQRLGQLYDAEMHNIIVQNYGNPLRRDIDNDGRLGMIFSQRVNGTAAAFVTGCDMFPTASAPSSNVGEYFYGSVPTSGASNPNSTAAPDGWLYFMMRTVIHEVKHIASLTARIANSASAYEVSWLEEATARHSEELWYRAHVSPNAWKSNIGWGSAATNGVFCDFSLTDATCNAQDALRRPNWGMRRHFGELRPWLLQPWNWSPFGDGTGQTGSVFYNSGWSLVRYAVDRYGASDANFLTALNQATAQTGMSNIAARAGVSTAQLIGGWGLAMIADDYPGLSNPSADIAFPTWNLRSIYAGLNATPGWSTNFNKPYLLEPVVLSAASFTATLEGLRGGGHAYFEANGTAGGSQLLHLTAPNGSTPSTNLRIAIARVQ